MSRKSAFHNSSVHAREGGQDDAALTRHIRDLALRLRVDGTARLRLNAAPVRALERAVGRVRALDETLAEGDAALLRLRQDARLLLACARQTLVEDGGRLPASEGVPRVLWIAEALLSEGEAPVTRDRLLLALAAFDEVQALTMAELWAAPLALRAALSRCFARTAETAAKRALACEAASRWVRKPSEPLGPRDDDFYERALKFASEWELGAARERLLAHLARRGQSADAVIRRVHDATAREALRLENLIAAMRLLDDLDWEADFGVVSQADQALRRDPSGTYGGMDAASRKAVQRHAAAIAKRLRLTELTVARYAVKAAREAAEPRQCTVCYWLAEDEGRRGLVRSMGMPGAKLPRVVPDPTGKKSILALMGLAALLFVLFALLIERKSLLPLGLPMAWAASSALVGRFYPRLFRPHTLLRLEYKALPDDVRTLVVLPALLSGVARAEAACDQLEALGCLERDGNLSFLLLGDFADGDAETAADDEAIASCVRARMESMNARAGREKYAWLHRPRVLLERDGRWMGRDRKRGALMALNRVLLGEPGAEAAFSVENAACARLEGRFRYVITLDADTRMLPGTAHRLVGALSHPLNRREGAHGYAILQPRMETLPSGCANAFVRLFHGAGGMDVYPVAVSSLWQDLTGRGIYAGKGIYEIAAFQAAVEGRLPEGRVLSHDLIEGALAGAASLGDVTFYDAAPETLSGTLRRLHRWTRGDWQLLPFLLNRDIAGADRWRMLENLLRSLRAPAQLTAILAGLALGDAGVLLAALLTALLEPLLSLFNGDKLKWRRALAELAILPGVAWTQLDAVARTLWRLSVSGRHLMDWVAAADAERRGGAGRLPGWIAALLALSGILQPGMAAVALGFALLFALGPGWVADMENEALTGRPPVNERDAEDLMALARETWRFFETSVPPGTGALPPDNVQVDPPVGAARRTSPTNIGLYMLSCLAANRLGLIDGEETLSRVRRTTDALERMEKWRGHLYNWHDVDTLAPLRPRYVSAVDSGNLAAALLLCASALETSDAVLAGRLSSLAHGMDFTALYDERRELFAIGLDAERGELSRAHYDLLASEARILSFTSMMLGQIPLRHWRRLNRACVPAGQGMALISWSGTMFEYLMPELLMPAPPHSLLGGSVRAVVRAQMRRGRRLNRPWGVSESGYYAFDAELNYQYRAFGLAALALGGQAEDGVTAPYASLLAAALAPEVAAENLRAMRALGWSDACGLFEAADYRHTDAEGRPAVVKSHMAHHQGMILCALCNALAETPLSDDFMRLPEARALMPLLEEKPAPKVRFRGRERQDETGGGLQRYAAAARPARPDLRLAETHLLCGGGASALVTADGAAHYWRGDTMATRFSGRLLDRRDPARVILSVGGAAKPLADAAAFAPGSARFEARLGAVEAAMRVCLSPEDGTLIREITLTNGGSAPVDASVTDAVPAALASPADYRAHAAFQNLFVESMRPEANLLVLRRRPRNPGERHPLLAHLACGSERVQWETDYEKLAGRGSGFPQALTGALGATLNPVSALQLTLRLMPGETRRARFCLALLEGEAPEDWRRRQQAALAERAERLASARAQAMLGFLGIRPPTYHLLQRMAAGLLDAALAAELKGFSAPAGGVPTRELWALGLSGDPPILLLRMTSARQEGTLREAVRAHGFYRAMGLRVDLVLLDEGEGGYQRPVRRQMDAAIDSGHLRTLRGQPGGVHILEELTPEQREVLFRAAALIFDGAEDFFAQARTWLRGLERRTMPKPIPLDVGASTLPPMKALAYNGFGGFTEDGYAIDVRPGRPVPAPWCNVLANDLGGMLLTERGGGFFWHGNSRSGRMTAFSNDSLRENWGIMLFLVNDLTGEALRLLPGEEPERPFRVAYSGAGARYRFEAVRLAGEVLFYLNDALPEARVELTLENRGLRAEGWRVVAFVDWLMGTFPEDAGTLRAWSEGGACFASGRMPGVGYFACAAPEARGGAGRLALLGRGTVSAPEGLLTRERSGGWTLEAPIRLEGAVQRRFALGWAEGVPSAREAVFQFQESGASKRREVRDAWDDYRSQLILETPDAELNALFNHFLAHQVLAARVRGRTGFYQPGGACGFRDQLQDMLALLHFDPARVRAHLLRCAARQFEVGDVLHWWHPPFTGVRTRISDDRLFLPWVTAAYVQATGDAAVLGEAVPYLEDVPIPPDANEIYAEMRPGETSGTLHDHCMRAFRLTARVGAHGLPLMGTGDWNDGMNRVGDQGRGESVWLAEFLAACAEAYARIAPEPEDAAWLKALCERMKAAVEAAGWDGAWYLRAYDDAGRPLGGRDCEACRIDAIAQAWAVLAGLDATRCESAMDAAWEALADPEHRLIRLLTPPFGEDGSDPGYIRGYPAGIRENGAQYTHGALWLLLALIRQGDAERAHQALDMLLPVKHSDTPEKAAVYRVEPYVMAGDVCASDSQAGRGGWSWYTGAASWMMAAVLALLGYERHGNRVRLNALLDDWKEASLTVRYGSSRYRLTCGRDVTDVTLDGARVPDGFIEMADDGRRHEVRFPARQGRKHGRLNKRDAVH